MRGKVKNRNIPSPDTLYNSAKLSKFMNVIMWDGKKETARKIVYGALDAIKEKLSETDKDVNPIEVFDMALKNAGPTVRSSITTNRRCELPSSTRCSSRATTCPSNSMDYRSCSSKERSGYAHQTC
jgi:small subunit ribosomal protein S7